MWILYKSKWGDFGYMVKSEAFFEQRLDVACIKYKECELTGKELLAVLTDTIEKASQIIEMKLWDK